MNQRKGIKVIKSNLKKKCTLQIFTVEQEIKKSSFKSKWLSQ